jgi:DNA-dependent RNA polymerase auxiliary subunit epsilon
MLLPVREQHQGAYYAELSEEKLDKAIEDAQKNLEFLT